MNSAYIKEPTPDEALTKFIADNRAEMNAENIVEYTRQVFMAGVTWGTEIRNANLVQSKINRPFGA